MPITRLLLMMAALHAAAIVPARSEPIASRWVEGFNNRARLIAGSAPDGGAARTFAALEIAMPKGWKTYWRSAGDAGGIPPEFEWTESENLAEAKVLYPAPRRLTDKSGDVVGYLEKALFPIAVVAKDPAATIKLRGHVRYGVCKDLCVPAEVTLAIDIPPDLAGNPDIASALAAVPGVAKPDSDPSLSAWSFDSAPARPSLRLEVKSRAAAESDAFVDVADGTYVPLPRRTNTGVGTAIFEIDLSDGVDLAALKGKDLRITLVDSEGQSETKIRLE